MSSGPDVAEVCHAGSLRPAFRTHQTSAPSKKSSNNTFYTRCISSVRLQKLHCANYYWLWSLVCISNFCLNLLGVVCGIWFKIQDSTPTIQLMSLTIVRSIPSIPNYQILNIHGEHFTVIDHLVVMMCRSHWSDLRLRHEIRPTAIENFTPTISLMICCNLVGLCHSHQWRTIRELSDHAEYFVIAGDAKASIDDYAAQMKILHSVRLC